MMCSPSNSLLVTALKLCRSRRHPSPDLDGTRSITFMMLFFMRLTQQIVSVLITLSGTFDTHLLKSHQIVPRFWWYALHLYDVGASYWFLAAADKYGLTLAASPLADLESCGERSVCRGETALGLTLNLAMVRRESTDWLVDTEAQVQLDKIMITLLSAAISPCLRNSW